MSRLRAKCPDCRTYTAVALGPDYQCHACGREFRAGLVRVPRAWGNDGEAMAEAAMLPLAYPETGVIGEDTLADQTLAIAAELPERPLILGGCCCAHIGAIDPTDVVLVGARDLDPPEEEFIAASGIHRGADELSAVLDRTQCVYVALDVDAIEPDEVASHMPAPGGLHVDEVERLFAGLRGHVVGAGITGGVPDPRNVAPLERLCAALGL